MHLTRSLLLAGACLGFAASAAQALGFGSPPAGVALGSPLDFVLPVRLDAGEALDPECLSAELQIGERRVPSYNLRWAVEPGSQPGERRIRVVSLVVVDEPVIVVQVNTGCAARISRRFTLLADPPLGSAAPQAPAVATVSPATTGAPAEAARLAAASEVARAATAAPTPVATRASAPSVRTPRTPRRATAQSVRPSRPRAVTAAVAPRARLSLEAPDPGLVQQAVAAALAQQQASAALAAESARVAQEAASAAAARVQAMEQQLQRLQAEGREQQAQLQQLRAQAGRDQQAGRWLPWLGTALFMALAAVAWLAWRLQQARRESHAKWWSDAAAVLADARPDHAPTPQAGGPPVAPAPPARATAATVPLASASPDADAVGPAPETDALAGLGLAPATADADTLQAAVSVEPGWTRTGPPPRPVSVEELIDLEQQAEFFVVLGQDEEAIDLLVSHLRDSGGISPLPYLKLLEIYRRQGDRDAYERTRTRFNQRFNAYAPEWDADMQHGRALEDYPQVMGRLQAAWASPIDAMAALETLLFRKDGGELFELPAYREVLLLYSLARELLDQRPGAPRSDVDVLLPLDFDLGQPAESAAERTLVLAPDAVPDLAPDPVREPPTRFDTVDLDLTAPDAPPAASRG